MDTAPPAVHTLLEIRKYCPEVFDRLEVWVDGGIKRGTDVVKALCLGAKAVGVGRAALFGLGAGGIEGVKRMLHSKFKLHMLLTWLSQACRDSGTQATTLPSCQLNSPVSSHLLISPFQRNQNCTSTSWRRKNRTAWHATCEIIFPTFPLPGISHPQTSICSLLSESR